MSEFETFFGRQARGRLPDGFKKDLQGLLQLSETARTALAKNVGKFLLVQSEGERQALANDLDSRFGNEPVPLEGPIRVLMNFAAIFLSDVADNPSANDDPIKLAADFGKMDGMFPEDRPKAERVFADTLKIVKETALATKDDVRKRGYEVGVLPVFNSLGTTVELRAVLESRYRWGENVSDYNPVLAGFVGIASINIGFDSGHPKSVAFQVSGDDLTKLIDGLQSTLKELRLVERTIRTNERTARSS